MIGEFVAQREADAQHGPVVADHITADQFRLLAAFQGKGRHRQRMFRRRQPAAISLIEPLRRYPDLPRLRFSAFQPETEHAHRVGQRLLFVGAEFLVHGVARLGAAEMIETGAAEDQAGRVGMIERRQEPFSRHDRAVFDALTAQPICDQFGQRLSAAPRLPGQVIDPFGAVENVQCLLVFDHRHPAVAGLCAELHQSHHVFSSTAVFGRQFLGFSSRGRVTKNERR